MVRTAAAALIAAAFSVSGAYYFGWLSPAVAGTTTSAIKVLSFGECAIAFAEAEDERRLDLMKMPAGTKEQMIDEACGAPRSEE